LFGPDGKLFTPLLLTGELRAYDLTNNTFTTIIAAGDGLINPFFMTFGQTNPSTLAFEGMGTAVLTGTTAIPEPASVALVGLGVLAIFGCVGTGRRR
jgi:hypothetical protein